ncbi:type VII secretion target [Actinophytocola sp.]|uniref:type VII secretion target n=1 Tax=Actinophytocola sp. TaxID=1872138 RepID=UPI002D7FD631|nr:type VII secretion target [Actinophytocola sp.]HET9143018.1 type VII secretion target [Actinophytocola sp.]
MSDGVKYDTAALANHATTLGRLAGELRAVLAGVGSVELTDTAYGQTGRAGAVAINALGRVGQQALAEGVTALELAGTNMTATAAAYDRQDEEAAERLNKIIEEPVTS